MIFLFFFLIFKDKISANKGRCLSGRVIFHARGRLGRKVRPRTHIYVTLKEMPEKMRERKDAWNTREELWREHIRSKKDQIMALPEVKDYPNINFCLAETQEQTYAHNIGKLRKNQPELSSENQKE